MTKRFVSHTNTTSLPLFRPAKYAMAPAKWSGARISETPLQAAVLLRFFLEAHL
jgi:hypothetical protein